MKASKVNRRKFLKTGSLIGAGLFIPFTIPLKGKSKKATEDDESTINAFLHISTENKIKIISSKVEMGQGIFTTLAILIGEELNSNPKDIEVIHSPADKAYNHAFWGFQITAGSSSTYSEFDRYRKAGAQARSVLIQAAANKAGVSTDKCIAKNGTIMCDGQQFTYGQLASDAAKISLPENVTLKQPEEWIYIGKSIKRVDITNKVNGKAEYAIDARGNNQLIAVVAHAPVIGATLKNADSNNALKIKGVKEVLNIPTGVAVIAENYWSATQGRKALKLEWNTSANQNLSSQKIAEEYKAAARTQGKLVEEKGNPKAANNNSTIEVDYIMPYLSHSAMEPMNCTIELNGEKCTVTTGTQTPQVAQGVTAQILGIPSQNITIKTPYIGGAFGRRAQTDFIEEAAHIIKNAKSTRHIKLVWSREDDMKGMHYRSLFVHHIETSLNKNGYPETWQHHIVGQPLSNAEIDEASVEGVHGSPYFKNIPNYKIQLTTTSQPIHVAYYRSVGHSHSGFVMETFIDKLASQAKIDPLEYRQTLLQDNPRHLRVLNLVADKYKWSESKPTNRHKGIAVHECFGSYVAIALELSFVNNQPKIHKVVCGIDCGLAVNPDGVIAQMEGGIVYGLTMALHSEISIESGIVKQNNFYDYCMLRMNDSPEIEVHIVASTEKMGGAGECAVPATAAALGNAIYAATGKHITTLPLIRNYEFI